MLTLLKEVYTLAEIEIISGIKARTISKYLKELNIKKNMFSVSRGDISRDDVLKLMKYMPSRAKKAIETRKKNIKLAREVWQKHGKKNKSEQYLNEAEKCIYTKLKEGKDIINACKECNISIDAHKVFVQHNKSYRYLIKHLFLKA